MPVLLIVVVLLVLGTLAVVASTRSDAVEGALPGDAPEVAGALGLPPPGERVDVADLDALRFSVVARGYRPSEVEAVLDRLAEEIAHRDGELEQLRDELISSRREPDPSAGPLRAAEHPEQEDPAVIASGAGQGDSMIVTTPGPPPGTTLLHSPLNPPGAPTA